MCTHHPCIIDINISLGEGPAIRVGTAIVKKWDYFWFPDDQDDQLGNFNSGFLFPMDTVLLWAVSLLHGNCSSYCLCFCVWVGFFWFILGKTETSLTYMKWFAYSSITLTVMFCQPWLKAHIFPISKSLWRRNWHCFKPLSCFDYSLPWEVFE